MHPSCPFSKPNLSSSFLTLSIPLVYVIFAALPFLALLLPLSSSPVPFFPCVSPLQSPPPLLLCLDFSSALLPLEFCVESTTAEFVLLPLIRLVLIFLPPSRSSAEWMNFCNCLSEAHLHCTAQRPHGLLPAIYYEIKINGC